MAAYLPRHSNPSHIVILSRELAIVVAMAAAWFTYLRSRQGSEFSTLWLLLVHTRQTGVFLAGQHESVS